jgi:membrane protein YqaA with SNARE-associated domain
MNSLIYLILVVLVINLAPAFAPPTWTVLVFFSLNSDLPPWLIVIVGAVCAGFGRYNLARLTGLLRFRIKGKALQNLQSAQKILEAKSLHKVAVLTLFVLSPLPSAQLFEAAGLIGTRLVPLTLAFFSGRLVTYSFYVAGANQLKEKGIGDLITEQFSSIWAIIFQCLLIASVFLLTKIDLSHLLDRDESKD